MDIIRKQQTPDMIIKTSQPRKGNITLLAQTRKMVYDVYCFLKKDAARQNCIMTNNQLIERTSEATQTSVSTIRRILHEAKTTDIQFKTPGTVRKRAKPVTDLDHYNKELVRNCIRNFQNTDKKPSVNRLLAKLQSDINFKGSEASLRRILKELGYKWKKVDKNRKGLIECSPTDPKPVPVFVEIDPSCYEGVTIKREMDDHDTDTENFEHHESDDLETDPSDYEDHETNPVNYKNNKTDPVSYVGVRIKKEDEYQENDNLSSIYIGVTIKRETKVIQESQMA